MQFAWGATLACLVMLSASDLATAANISTTTKDYKISGTTGDALFRSMNRKGPKHGFLSRAIAQTEYRVSWDVKVGVRNGACKLARAKATMKMVYTYPQPGDQLSPALRKRWNTFLVSVKKHEQQHGRYAVQMVNAAERSVAGYQRANDPTCRRTEAEIKKRVNAVYEEYEAKQVVFDRREHRPNGNIHRLVKALTKD